MSELPSAEAEACRQLWVAVLAQAAHDILAPNPRGTGCKNAGDAARLGAVAWLRTRDFSTVCALAGIAPDTARARIEGLRMDMNAGLLDLRAVVGTGGGSWKPRAAGLGDRVCAVPDCGTALSSQNGSGLCRRHNHAPGYCHCHQCGGGEA